MSWREIRAQPVLAIDIVHEALLDKELACIAPPPALTIRNASFGHDKASSFSRFVHDFGIEQLVLSRAAMEEIGALDAVALYDEAIAICNEDVLALHTFCKCYSSTAALAVRLDALNTRYSDLQPKVVRHLIDYILARDEPWFETATRQATSVPAAGVTPVDFLCAAIEHAHLGLVEGALTTLDNAVVAKPLSLALHKLARYPSTERRAIVDRLFAANVSLETVDFEETPLASAASTTIELVDRLLALGADPTQMSGSVDDTALHRAVDAAIVRRLVAVGADVHARDKFGAPPILRAKTVDVIDALIAAGADIHAVDNLNNSLLMRRCRLDETDDLTRELLARGLDVHARGYQGMTALHQASHAAIPPLLAAGADIEARDESGATPLLTALAPDACRALLDAGASITAIDDRGLTVLHRTRLAECLEILVAAGARLDTRDHAGRTPLEHVTWLHEAKQRGDDVGDVYFSREWLDALRSASTR